MKRLMVVAFAVILLMPSWASAICIATQAGDWDDCSIRRGSRETASWCGEAGTGGRAGGFRAALEALLAKYQDEWAALVEMKPGK